MSASYKICKKPLVLPSSCISNSVGWMGMQSLPCCTTESALKHGVIPVVRFTAFHLCLLPTHRSSSHSVLWQCMFAYLCQAAGCRGRQVEVAYLWVSCCGAGTVGQRGRAGEGESKCQVLCITSLGHSGATWAALNCKNVFSETLKVFWEVWIKNSSLQTYVITKANKYRRCM